MKVAALERRFVPLAGRILIRPIENTAEDRQRGSIELSEDALPTQRAEVVSVGRGEVAPQTGVIVPMETKKGDIVLIRKGIPALPVRMNGEDLLMVKEFEVEAILEKSRELTEDEKLR